jgi:hypothetical protein
VLAKITRVHVTILRDCKQVGLRIYGKHQGESEGEDYQPHRMDIPHTATLTYIRTVIWKARGKRLSSKHLGGCDRRIMSLRPVWAI